MNQLEGLFKTIIEHYKEVSLQTGKASSSIIVESNYAAAFFAYMQRRIYLGRCNRAFNSFLFL